ncbi:hypothetical protein [Catenulispora yoronensis]|uniref:hypothetical protein n=1 Tax=Catenulispora yoronensis TaxID=450799 RepID=UPI0031D39F8E
MSMWCLNPECAFLAEDEPARDGDTPWECPQCGELTFENARTAEVSRTATLNVEASVTLKVSISFWHSWARIAIAAAKQSAHWRAEADAAQEGHKAGDLSREFDAAVLAVAASAFTLDSFYASLAVPLAARRAARAKLNPKAARHVVVRTSLQECFATDHPTRQKWSTDLPWLFNLRDATVHPEQLFEDTVALPDGSMSTARREDYTALSAARAVGVMLDVLEFCADHPGTAYPEAATWASSGNRGGVGSLADWWHAKGWHPMDAAVGRN